MTDEEYRQFLTALARKHLRYLPSYDQALRDYYYPGHLRSMLGFWSENLRTLKLLKDFEEPDLVRRVAERIRDSAPVKLSAEAMEAAGILAALDDAHELALGELRRSSIPPEDAEYLRSAGFDEHETEVFLALAIHGAHGLARSGKLPSDIAKQADEALQNALAELTGSMAGPPTKPKRKLLNAIGKFLGGAVAGVGNVLLVMGTVAAPNPATAYGAIASGGVAVGSFFAGLGDLKGE